MNSAHLSVNGVSKRFGGVAALADVDLQVAPGAVTALVGPNGSGKTTLVDCVTGFQRPTSGRVTIGGRDVTRASVPAHVRAGIRRTFQTAHVFPDLSVVDHLILAQQRMRGPEWAARVIRAPWLRQSGEAHAQRAKETLALIGLEQHAASRADQISYGQQKLMALGIALVTDPALLCLDEPLAGVNPRLIDAIIDVVGELRRRGIAVLVVEHNIEFVHEVADEVVVLAEGAVLTRGEPSLLNTDDRVFDILIGASVATR